MKYLDSCFKCSYLELCVQTCRPAGYQMDPQSTQQPGWERCSVLNTLFLTWTKPYLVGARFLLTPLDTRNSSKSSVHFSDPHIATDLLSIPNSTAG